MASSSSRRVCRGCRSTGSPPPSPLSACNDAISSSSGAIPASTIFADPRADILGRHGRVAARGGLAEFLHLRPQFGNRRALAGRVAQGPDACPLEHRHQKKRDQTAGQPAPAVPFPGEVASSVSTRAAPKGGTDPPDPLPLEGGDVERSSDFLSVAAAGLADAGPEALAAPADPAAAGPVGPEPEDEAAAFGVSDVFGELAGTRR